MIITYPLLTILDDAGAIVSGATVTVASVTTKAGAAISSPGATVNLAGANVSVDYDAELKGEAWVTLAVSKVGSTFTGLNASPAFYLSKDPSKIEGGVPLDLAQAITDVKTATVGGALNGAWATAWGKVVKDVGAMLLKVWGAGNATGTPSATFGLDDGTNPTTRTPQ